MKLFKPEALEYFSNLEKENFTDFILNLIHQYEVSSESLLTELLQGFRERNRNKIHLAAHTLRSSSQMLGLQKLAENCAAIEKAVQENMHLKIDISMMPTLYRVSLKLLKDHLDKRVS